MLLACIAVSAQTIQPNQAIRINVSGVPAEEKARIDADYPVGGNGTINMPYIGVINAAGLKPEVLAATLQSRYKSAQIFRDPTFQVFANTTGGSVVDEIVHIGGQVRKTGPVKFTRGLTIYQAIQAAGGPTEFGNMKKVKLLRAGKQRQYDLTQLQFTQIPLDPNDTIEVPQKGVFN
jgi:protein involved in polysaccharide export with SLBB domain